MLVGHHDTAVVDWVAAVDMVVADVSVVAVALLAEVDALMELDFAETFRPAGEHNGYT